MSSHTHYIIILKVKIHTTGFMLIPYQDCAGHCRCPRHCNCVLLDKESLSSTVLYGTRIFQIKIPARMASADPPNPVPPPPTDTGSPEGAVNQIKATQNTLLSCTGSCRLPYRLESSHSTTEQRTKRDYVKLEMKRLLVGKVQKQRLW